MSSKIYQDPDVGLVTFTKNKRSRRVSIRVYPDKGVRVTIPYYSSYQEGIRFFLSQKEWVLYVVEKNKATHPETAMDPEQKAEQVEKLRALAKATLPVRLYELASRYGFKYNKVFIKHNSSNWGSCSGKGNINLNLNLVRLPLILADYVMLHELCHLRHANHGEEFHALLEKLCQDHFEKMYDSGDQTCKDLLSEIKKTRALHPVEHVLEKSLKQWRLI